MWIVVRAISFQVYLTRSKFHEQASCTRAPWSAIDPHKDRIIRWTATALEEVEEHVLRAIGGVKVARVAPSKFRRSQQADSESA